MSKRCKTCGSYAFNLHQKDIDQGDFCDVHYYKAQRDQLRKDVWRLREAAEAVLTNEEHAFSGGMRSYQKGSQTWQVYEDLRAALTHQRSE